MIEIYHEGVVTRLHVRGKKRYIAEKTFLNELVYGVAAPPPSVPDPQGDLYELDAEQMIACGELRRRLNRAQ